MKQTYDVIGFTNLVITAYNGDIFTFDYVQYSNVDHKLTIEYDGSIQSFQIAGCRDLKNEIYRAFFLSRSDDGARTVSAQLIGYMVDFMGDKDKKVINEGDALLSNFIFDYKKTRNYTLLVEDHKLSDDEIFGGLIYGAGRADVHSAWELYFDTKKFELVKIN